MRDSGSPPQEFDIRASDAEPNGEQVFKEIVETRRELSKRMDRIEAIAHENRADLRDVEDRLDKIESELAQEPLSSTAQ